MIKLDLGGTGNAANGWTTVNAVGDANVKLDFVKTSLSTRYKAGTVDAVRMIHTLEHIPVTEYKAFLREVQAVLKKGGVLYVLQTDILKLAAQAYGNPQLEAVWKTCAFTPAQRVVANAYNVHHGGWSQALMEAELNALGFEASNLQDSPDEWEAFKADLGPYFSESWPYDLVDDIQPEHTQAARSYPIPNLTVKAVKR
jgi:predicted SAM-dependent methyltransferase